jgi:transposase InsO family protein
MALATRRPSAGLIHHSDRGVQYASGEYVSRLEEVGAEISMATVGNPYENAKAESFFRTLKLEEVYLKDYRNFEEAQESIGEFIEEVYNEKRLHSSLGYLPPVEFEASSTLQRPEVDLATGPEKWVHTRHQLTDVLHVSLSDTVTRDSSFRG